MSISIKEIRADPEKFRKNQISRFSDPKLIDSILELDTKCIKEDYMFGKLNQIKNIIKAQFRKAKNRGKSGELPDDILISLYNTIYDCVQTNKLDVITLENLTLSELASISKYTSKKLGELAISKCKGERDSLVNNLCNILHQGVPIDSDEEHNIVICVKEAREAGEAVEAVEAVQAGKLKRYNHVDLCDKLNIVDRVRGSKLAGNRGYFLKELGVKLNMALMAYAMDFGAKRGYKQMYVPHFLNSDIMERLCQLQDFDETLYKLNIGEAEKGECTTKYLIATSEQPLTGYYMDYKFKPGELPVRLCGISTCYRRETGRHGKDTLGIFRVHQFEKVEQLCITEARDSDAMFNEMIANAKEFYDSLGLSYRIVSIVSGALNNAAAIKYDLEGYFAGSGTYRELVSCSNCTDYFSRKLNIKDLHGNYVHILNSTLCANTRTLCCILEQYQTETGIMIPDVLKAYMKDVDQPSIDFIQ
jgi:seryl-tRNA synthetase